MYSTMKYDDVKKQIYLKPGEFYFGDRSSTVVTLLGSCVAITLWHPQKQIGGICHYQLPTPKFRSEPHRLNTNYAEDAMIMFLMEIAAINTRPSEYHVKVFGGGNMFSKVISYGRVANSFDVPREEVKEYKNVSCRNIVVAKEMLDKHGFRIVNHDVGGNQYRKVYFEIETGDVWLQRGNVA